MLTITEKAAEKAKAILAAEGKADWGLRIYTAGSSCCSPSYGLDIDEKATDNDDVIEKDGLKVFVEKSMVQNLQGLKLDYYEDSEREGFVLAGDSSCGGSCSSSGCGGGCG